MELNAVADGKGRICDSSIQVSDSRLRGRRTKLFDSIPRRRSNIVRLRRKLAVTEKNAPSGLHKIEFKVNK